MSEQTIWNGTFLLGNTSACTIEAGEGIKIDTTQPGTIKISNDETVLWSGSVISANDTINLNESFENFERIRYEISEDNQYITDHMFECYAVGASSYPKYMYPMLYTEMDSDPNKLIIRFF